MPSIGETLREARMRQRLDIADVEARTKIRAKYLRALENEEFSLLPGSTFVKTFLRTYAEVLGLDPHLLVEEYRAGYESPDEAEVQPLAPQATGGRERDRPRPPPPSPGFLIGAFVVAVLALLIVLGVTGEEDGGEEARAPGAETAERPQRTERGRPEERRPRVVRLSIVPEGETYVCVDNGPGTDIVFEGTVVEEQRFRGRRLRVNLGRTAVQVSVNGEPFPVEASAEPVGFDFRPGGSRPIPVEERPCVA